MITIGRVFTLVLVLFSSILAHAGSNVKSAEWSLDLPSGETLPVSRYAAKGDDLLIWTPSEFGIHAKRLAPLATKLAKRGIEVWLCDFHAAYFVQRGRQSINQFSVKDLAFVIDTAVRKKKKRIVLVSGSNGARYVLNGIHQWRQKNKTNTSLKGAILFSPSLYSGRPALGNKASYIDIVYNTKIPLYLIQPEYSTTSLRANDLREALTQAGSPVFVHYMAQTIDGFHARPISHLKQADLKARKALPVYLSGAIKQLTLSAAQKNNQVQTETTKPTVRHADTKPGLRVITSKTQFQFKLPSLDNKAVKLTDFRGKPVIVSFWASWCPPCVRELPSMNALAHDPKYGKIPIVMVNIGESPDQIRNFLQLHKVKASILLDRDKAVYKDWNIYVVPSNFVFNAKGELVLGSVGAIDWTSNEVKQQLDSLL